MLKTLALGMFILDEFLYEDPSMRPLDGPKDLQIGGAGVYGPSNTTLVESFR